MKALKIIFLAVVVSVAMSGCFSIDTAVIRHTNEEHLLVSNYGWSLFGVIPLVCGNASVDAFSPFAFFRNDVSMDKIQRRFMMYADEKGVYPHDLTYEYYDSVLFEIPGTSLPVPIPYILTYREIQLSGVMK